MGSGTLAMAYMTAKGSSQGGFHGDASPIGKDRTQCMAVRFRGDVPHDVRGGKHATTRHEPIAIVHEWGAVTVQLLSALWSNETLDQVQLEFIRPDKAGKEEVFATMSLSKATVAHVELRSGQRDQVHEDSWRPLAEVGLVAEKIEFKLKDGAGQVTAAYDRQKQS